MNEHMIARTARSGMYVLSFLLFSLFAAVTVVRAWTAPGSPPPNGGSGGFTPVGTIEAYAGAVAPAGWLLCNGQSVPQASYPALYAVIGTTYGGGGGNFTLPDLRDRSALGASVSRPLGSTGGAATIDLSHAHTATHAHSTANHVLTWNEMASHTHGVTDPGHSHTVTIWSRNAQDQPSLAFREGPPVVATAYGTSANATGISLQNAGANGGHNHGNTGNASPVTDSQLAGARSVINPYQAGNFIIKY